MQEQVVGSVVTTGTEGVLVEVARQEEKRSCAKNRRRKVKERKKAKWQVSPGLLLGVWGEW